jgi:hypothetical protein
MRLCDRCHTLDGHQGDWLRPGNYPPVIEWRVSQVSDDLLRP